VRVVSSISVPGGMHPSEMRSQLEKSAVTLSHQIDARLQSLVGIRDVTTGNLSVSEVRPLGEAISPGPQVRLDILSAAVILLVAAAVWLWCRLCASRKLEGTGNQRGVAFNSLPQTEPSEPLLTRIGANKSPRSGVLVTPESGMPVSTTDAAGHATGAIGPSSASTASREAEEQDETEEGEHDNPFEFESGAEESEQENLEGSGNPFESQQTEESSPVRSPARSPVRGNPFDFEPSVELEEEFEAQKRGR